MKDEETIMTEEKHFCYDKLIHSLGEVEKTMDNLIIQELLKALNEISKFLHLYGDYMNLSYIDIQLKISNINQCLNDYYTETNFLQEIIETEISSGLTELNGLNNTYKGFNKISKFNKYISISRTVLRIIHIFDFINQILRNILLTNDDLYICILNSYNNTIGKYHTPIKKSFSLMILSLIPKSKSIFVKNLLNNEGWDEENKEKIALLSKLIESVWRYLYNYFDNKNLLELP